MTLPHFFRLAFYAPATLGVVVGACVRNNKIYLSEASDDEKVFRKPLSLRLGAGLLGLSVLQLPLSFTASGWGVFVLSLPLCLFIGRTLLLVSSPDELRLSMTERTFRRVRGWRFWTTTWSGAWADLKCVSLTTYSGKGGCKWYSVGVRGLQMGGQMKLGDFTALDLAQRFAGELVSLTGLPLVALGRLSEKQGIFSDKTASKRL